MYASDAKTRRKHIDFEVFDMYNVWRRPKKRLQNPYNDIITIMSLKTIKKTQNMLYLTRTWAFSI